MKKQWSRVLALMLSLSMVITCIPANVRAVSPSDMGQEEVMESTAETPQENEEKAQEPSSENPAAGEEAGENEPTATEPEAATEEPTATEPEAATEEPAATEPEATTEEPAATEPEAEEKDTPAEGNGPLTKSAAISSDEGIDGEEAFAAYVNEKFYGKKTAGGARKLKAKAATRRSQLSAINQEIYDQLSTAAAEIAEGDRDSAIVTVTLSDEYTAAYTAEQLGIDAIVEGGNISDVATAALDETLGLDLDALLSALLADHPYEFYWYDKSADGSFAMSAEGGGCYNAMNQGNGWEIYLLNPLEISFKVEPEYQNGDTYAVDTEKTGAASYAASKARDIVSAHSEEGDYQKLVSYRDAICGAVDYNEDARNSGHNDANGNAWQMIYVFDEDPATNVVCEGYSKAFQYLCDQSDFEGTVECHSMTGDMDGGTGAGAHMWNVVKIGGENYLADITNSDEGTVGQDGELFMTGAPDGNANGYTVADVEYTYDDDTLSQYSDEERTLATSDFDPDNYVPETNALTAAKIADALALDSIGISVDSELDGCYRYYTVTIPYIGDTKLRQNFDNVNLDIAVPDGYTNNLWMDMEYSDDTALVFRGAWYALSPFARADAMILLKSINVGSYASDGGYWNYSIRASKDGSGDDTYTVYRTFGPDDSIVIPFEVVTDITPLTEDVPQMLEGWTDQWFSFQAEAAGTYTFYLAEDDMSYTFCTDMDETIQENGSSASLQKQLQAGETAYLRVYAGGEENQITVTAQTETAALQSVALQGGSTFVTGQEIALDIQMATPGTPVYALIYDEEYGGVNSHSLSHQEGSIYTFTVNHAGSYRVVGVTAENSFRVQQQLNCQEIAFDVQDPEDWMTEHPGETLSLKNYDISGSLTIPEGSTMQVDSLTIYGGANLTVAGTLRAGTLRFEGYTDGNTPLQVTETGAVFAEKTDAANDYLTLCLDNIQGVDDKSLLYGWDVQQEEYLYYRWKNDTWVRTRANTPDPEEMTALTLGEEATAGLLSSWEEDDIPAFWYIYTVEEDGYYELYSLRDDGEGGTTWERENYPDAGLLTNTGRDLIGEYREYEFKAGDQLVFRLNQRETEESVTVRLEKRDMSDVVTAQQIADWFDWDNMTAETTKTFGTAVYAEIILPLTETGIENADRLSESCEIKVGTVNEDISVTWSWWEEKEGDAYVFSRWFPTTEFNTDNTWKIEQINPVVEGENESMQYYLECADNDDFEPTLTYYRVGESRAKSFTIPGNGPQVVNGEEAFSVTATEGGWFDNYIRFTPTEDGEVYMISDDNDVSYDVTCYDQETGYWNTLSDVTAGETYLLKIQISNTSESKEITVHLGKDPGANPTVTNFSFEKTDMMYGDEIRGSFLASLDNVEIQRARVIIVPAGSVRSENGMPEEDIVRTYYASEYDGKYIINEWDDSIDPGSYEVGYIELEDSYGKVWTLTPQDLGWEEIPGFTVSTLEDVISGAQPGDTVTVNYISVRDGELIIPEGVTVICNETCDIYDGAKLIVNGTLEAGTESDECYLYVNEGGVLEINGTLITEAMYATYPGTWQMGPAGNMQIFGNARLYWEEGNDTLLGTQIYGKAMENPYGYAHIEKTNEEGVYTEEGWYWNAAEATNQWIFVKNNIPAAEAIMELSAEGTTDIPVTFARYREGDWSFYYFGRLDVAEEGLYRFSGSGVNEDEHSTSYYLKRADSDSFELFDGNISDIVLQAGDSVIVRIREYNDEYQGETNTYPLDVWKEDMPDVTAQTVLSWLDLNQIEASAEGDSPITATVSLPLTEAGQAAGIRQVEFEMAVEEDGTTDIGTYIMAEENGDTWTGSGLYSATDGYEPQTFTLWRIQVWDSDWNKITIFLNQQDYDQNATPGSIRQAYAEPDQEKTYTVNYKGPLAVTDGEDFPVLLDGLKNYIFFTPSESGEYRAEIQGTPENAPERLISGWDNGYEEYCNNYTADETVKVYVGEFDQYDDYDSESLHHGQVTARMVKNEATGAEISALTLDQTSLPVGGIMSGSITATVNGDVAKSFSLVYTSDANDGTHEFGRMELTDGVSSEFQTTGPWDTGTYVLDHVIVYDSFNHAWTVDASELPVQPEPLVVGTLQDALNNAEPGEVIEVSEIYLEAEEGLVIPAGVTLKAERVYVDISGDEKLTVKGTLEAGWIEVCDGEDLSVEDAGSIKITEYFQINCAQEVYEDLLTKVTGTRDWAAFYNDNNDDRYWYTDEWVYDGDIPSETSAAWQDLVPDEEVSLEDMMSGSVQWYRYTAEESGKYSLRMNTEQCSLEEGKRNADGEEEALYISWGDDDVKYYSLEAGETLWIRLTAEEDFEEGTSLTFIKKSYAPEGLAADIDYEKASFEVIPAAEDGDMTRVILTLPMKEGKTVPEDMDWEDTSANFYADKEEILNLSYEQANVYFDADPDLSTQTSIVMTAAPAMNRVRSGELTYTSGRIRLYNGEEGQAVLINDTNGSATYSEAAEVVAEQLTFTLNYQYHCSGTLRADELQTHEAGDDETAIYEFTPASDGEYRFYLELGNMDWIPGMTLYDSEKKPVIYNDNQVSSFKAELTKDALYYLEIERTWEETWSVGVTATAGEAEAEVTGITVPTTIADGEKLVLKLNTSEGFVPTRVTMDLCMDANVEAEMISYLATDIQTTTDGYEAVMSLDDGCVHTGGKPYRIITLNVTGEKGLNVNYYADDEEVAAPAWLTTPRIAARSVQDLINDSTGTLELTHIVIGGMTPYGTTGDLTIPDGLNVVTDRLEVLEPFAITGTIKAHDIYMTDEGEITGTGKIIYDDLNVDAWVNTEETKERIEGSEDGIYLHVKETETVYEWKNGAWKNASMNEVEIAHEAIAQLPAAEEVTLEDEEGIVAAEEAVAALTPEQKAELTQAELNKLAAAKARMEELKEAQAQEQADAAAVAAVEEAITALPAEADVQLTDEDAIEAADALFEALREDLKEKVSATAKLKLTTVKAKLAALQLNETKVAEVKAAIAAVPEAADVTLESEDAIEAAEAKLAALDENLQARITEEERTKVTAARTKLDELKANAEAVAEQERIDTEKAAAATEKIQAMPEDIDALTLEDTEAVQKAEDAIAAYDALTNAQKNKISEEDKAKVEAARAKLEELKEAAQQQAAEKAEMQAEERETVDAAKEVAEAISQMSVGAGIDDEVAVAEAKVAAAEEAVRKMDEAGYADDISAADRAAVADARAQVNDLKAVNEVVKEINNSVVEGASINEAGVKSARAKYNALTATQKAKMSAAVLKKLTDAETMIANAADQTAADKVSETLNALKAASALTAADEKTVTAARAAYNKLTAAQKARVSAAALKKLTDAEKKITDLKNQATQQAKDKAAADAEIDAEEKAGHKMVEAAAAEIINGGEEGPATSDFATLSAYVKKTSKTSLKVQWKTVPGAAGYIIYANLSGKKYKFAEEANIVGGGVKSTTLKTIAGKALKKNTYYKVLVVAYKNTKAAGKRVIATSKTIHVATSGGKNGNPTKLTGVKSKLTVKVKKKVTIKAKQKAKSGTKIKKKRAIKFESSDPSIATVSKKGVVKGVKPGKCTIYVYAQNGLSKKVKVTVKKK